MSFNAILTGARDYPASIAVIHNGNAISYLDFARALQSTHEHCKKLDLPKRKTVAVMSFDLADCWVTVMALQALGITTVCVTSIDLLEFLELKDIACILKVEEEFSSENLQTDTIGGYKVIQIPRPDYEGANLAVPLRPRESRELGDHILYTSGTTGKYKKIVATTAQQERRDAERIQQMELGETTRFHCADYGLWTSVGYMLPPSTWQARGCVIFDDRVDWHEYFRDSGVTNAVLLPDKLEELLGAMSKSAEPTPLMNLALHASGGFISRKLAQDIMTRLTDNLLVSYGSTEMPIASLESRVTDLDDLHWLAPTGMRQVEVVYADGTPCPAGEEGELRLRLEPQDCNGYLDNPEASDAVFRHDYFYPGDMAIQREDGRIRILGRSTEVVNFRGQKYATAPIELNIQNFLGITGACVFSGVNESGEDEVTIVLEVEQWPDKKKLQHIDREFKQFEQVRFAMVHPFPRVDTGTGKVNRLKLRQKVFDTKQERTDNA